MGSDKKKKETATESGKGVVKAFKKSYLGLWDKNLPWNKTPKNVEAAKKRSTKGN